MQQDRKSDRPTTASAGGVGAGAGAGGAADERPLTARSIVASTLLGMDPPESSGRVLVRAGELFGIAEGATRTAVSRMVAAGELDAVGDARYRLAGRLLTRRSRQDQSRRPVLERWEGDWHTAIVVASGARAAAERASLRADLHARRLAELREGVWMRPANLPAREPGGTGLPDAACQWFRATPDGGVPASRELAAALWDLDGWAQRGTALLGDMHSTRGGLRAGELGVLASCFVLAAAVLRHLQADPLLPAPLLPHRWPGAELRSTYDEYEQVLQGLMRRWHRTQT